MSKSNAWEARSWEELRELVSLDDIKKALLAAEKQRAYHKTQYLKRQALLARAKELGLDKDL
jgi:hypothetical protein